MLKTIRREALAGAVRVTLELEGEATFHDEEIEARLAFSSTFRTRVPLKH